MVRLRSGLGGWIATRPRRLQSSKSDERWLFECVALAALCPEAHEFGLDPGCRNDRDSRSVRPADEIDGRVGGIGCRDADRSAQLALAGARLGPREDDASEPDLTRKARHARRSRLGASRQTAAFRNAVYHRA